MKRSVIIIVFVIIVLFTVSNAVNADLIINGNNLIYDTDRDITWYNPDLSAMSWNEAMSWVQNLVVGSATDWRLPSAYNADGSYPLYEYNVTGSEMGHLYYVELGNPAYGPLTNSGFFANLQPDNYWSSTTTDRSDINAFIFNFGNGRQGHLNKPLYAYVLAVHSGNIQPAQTPIPGAALLLAPGLAGLLVVKRRYLQRNP